jgi:ribosomal protein S8
MMRLSNRELEIYQDIDFYLRYRSLVNNYRFHEGKEVCESLDKKTLQSLLNEIFKVDVIYFAKEKFWQVKYIENSIESIYNISLRYGYIESIFWIKSKEGKGYGSAINTIIKLIDKERSVETSSSEIGKPSFKSYEELKEILEKLKPLFDDFTAAFINSGILEKNT